MSARVVTVNEVLGGHAKLDIECLDRVYLNAYVPILQSSGQVVAFMTQHLGLPIPSPALFDKIGGGGHRPAAGRGDRGGAGAPAGVDRVPAGNLHRGAAVHLRQG
jgi:hypothetical protein